MSAESGSPQDFRESTRAPLEALATIQIDAFSEPSTGFTANVSTGGMFVQMNETPPVGSIVRFQVELGDPPTSVMGTAEVVWMRTQAQGSRQTAGIGLQFRYIEKNGEPLLSAAVHQALAELGTEPEPDPPIKRRPRPPRRPAGQPPPQRGNQEKIRGEKGAAPRTSKPAADGKQILGMPAEKAKLFLLLALMAFLLLTFLL